MFRIVILVSGGGTNCQALIDAVDNGTLEAKIVSVISDRPAVALERAQKHGIQTYCLSKKSGAEQLSVEIGKLIDNNVDLIVLAGFLSILSPGFIQKWKNRIVNIHPSLLPAFGGEGMYGMNVHHAVINAGCKESGCTVHLVDEGVDTGRILIQKTVPVLENDTAENLQKRILEKEHLALVEAVNEIIIQKK